MADSSVWIDVWHRLTPGFRGQSRIKISGHSQPNLAWDTYKVAAPTEKLKSHTPGNPSGPAVIIPDDQSVNMPTQQPTPSAPPANRTKPQTGCLTDALSAKIRPQKTNHNCLSMKR